MLLVQKNVTLDKMQFRDNGYIFYHNFGIYWERLFNKTA